MSVAADPGGTTRWGVSERLAPGAYPRAERFLQDIAELRIAQVRVEVMLDAGRQDDGRRWYGWLVERLAERASVTAALYRCPSASGVEPVPAWSGEAAGFRSAICDMVGVLGERCEWIELADALGPAAWPDTSPPAAGLLAEIAATIGGRLCLGGLPLDRDWLALAAGQGMLQHVQALAFSRPGPDRRWRDAMSVVAGALPGQWPGEVWLTPGPARGTPEGGGIPGRDLRAARADRIFLGTPGIDVTEDADGSREALRSTDGEPSLTARLLRRGDSALGSVDDRDDWSAGGTEGGHELILGGAGFIGCNLAARLADAGHEVLIFDSLSRPGTEGNAEWLCGRFPGRVRLLPADVRDRDAVRRAVAGARRVFHLAAQVAVTTSLRHPGLDHEINTLGTLNLLEAARALPEPPSLVFTSTNKVYGGLSDLRLVRAATGYEPADAAVRENGIDEHRPLDFTSPYGCSKGAADQYVLDYARTFGLPTAVLRMSCIYGPRQMGTEDQGWVAHFVRRTLAGEPITVYGDGLQVRDVLFVDDLLDALLAVGDSLPGVAGEAFNVGGGPANALSLRGLLDRLTELHGSRPTVHRRDWRPGDQRYYTSDTGKLRRLTGWRPRTGVNEGVRRLYEWLRMHPNGVIEGAGGRQGQVAL